MKFHKIPQPEDITVREREDAMGSYLMMFAAFAVGLPFPMINLIAAVVYYFVNKDKGRFVHFHILQSLYSQIPTSLLNIGFVAWLIQILFSFNHLEFNDYFYSYLLLVSTANVAYIIFSIIAAVKARQGRFFYFIFFGTLAFQQAYAKKEGDDLEEQIENFPPK